ncbi:chemotaxis protein CheD [Methanomicrobiaceae archaeon CYW5]|uniref:chemotaxis protein CheD n=1 Tax=Methanovulcanius yangii TaxID=1789227 RepID=UPI0029CA9F86|nr:chemotaxis protein CheD [Methanovulcanius yangii]MBT8507298.1 chemotaxis protein CheD [Methanovulcanius yangii]
MNGHTADTGDKINVGIGEFCVGSMTMTSIGLGSCIALVIHDDYLKIGGVAHIMLPDSKGRSERPGKFADTAVPLLKNELMERGSRPRSLQAKIIGGARMFQQFRGDLDIGSRNADAVRESLRAHCITLVTEETGGTSGRSVTYSPANGGKITIKQASGEWREL